MSAEPDRTRLLSQLAGVLLVLVATPAAIVAGALALVVTAAATAHGVAGAITGTVAVLLTSGGLTWWGVGRLTSSSLAKQVVAGAVAALTIGLSGSAAWTLVFAPGPRATPFVGDVKYWDLDTGSRIAHEHTPAAGPVRPYPVVIVHGGPGTPDRDTAGLDPALSEAGFDVYRYHQVGAGLSSRLPDVGDYTVDRHVADLEELRKVIRAERLVLVGSSWGGTLITSYLATHPDRVARAVVSSPSPLWAPAFPDDERLTEAGSRDQLATVREHPRFALANVLLQVVGSGGARALFPDNRIDGTFEEFVADIDLSPDCPGTPDSRGGAPTGVGFWANAMTVRDSRDVPDPRPELRGVTAPVLVLRAECDYLAWPVTREYRDLLPHAVLLPIDDTGHSIAEDQPQVYVDAVRSFLLDRELPGRPYESARPPW